MFLYLFLPWQLADRKQVLQKVVHSNVVPTCMKHTITSWACYHFLHIFLRAMILISPLLTTLATKVALSLTALSVSGDAA